jgi:hypothetical protein
MSTLWIDLNIHLCEIVVAIYWSTWNVRRQNPKTNEKKEWQEKSKHRERKKHLHNHQKTMGEFTFAKKKIEKKENIFFLQDKLLSHRRYSRRRLKYTQVVLFFTHMLWWLGNIFSIVFQIDIKGYEDEKKIARLSFFNLRMKIKFVRPHNRLNFGDIFFIYKYISMSRRFFLLLLTLLCLLKQQSENIINLMKIIKAFAYVTWHCWGPCRVGDAVFGLCFFTGVDETAAGKLEFDDGVTVVARVVMVSGCWVETTIEAGDADDDGVFCEISEADATVSITLATENK